MKPQNNQDITNGYLKFSFFLTACILVGVLAFSAYLKATSTEVAKIMNKMEEYDRDYHQQTNLTYKLDSLYYYVTLLDVNPKDTLRKSKNKYLQQEDATKQMINRQEKNIEKVIESMNNRDVRIYQKLLGEIRTFVQVKDSIRLLKEREDILRTDLRYCKQEEQTIRNKIQLVN